MKLKPILSAAAIAAATLGTLTAGGEGWSHDFEAAKKQAEEENKSLLLDFTGSDWCGWCIKLNEEVFQHDAFKDGVKDKFVLVEVDFPRDNSKLSEETKEQNKMLGEKYAVRGYPTILLVDAKGKPFGETGYQKGGPEKYVEHLDELLAGLKARDEAFEKAAGQEGVEKAKTLLSGLKEMELGDEMMAQHYADTIEEIKKADPEDQSGFVGEMEMKAKFAEYEEKVNGMARTQDHAGALKLTQDTIDNGGFEGENLQKLYFYKGMILAQSDDMEGAIASLDKAKEIAPESEIGMQVESIKGQMQEAQEAAEESKEEEAAPAAEEEAEEAKDE